MRASPMRGAGGRAGGPRVSDPQPAPQQQQPQQPPAQQQQPAPSRAAAAADAAAGAAGGGLPPLPRASSNAGVAAAAAAAGAMTVAEVVAACRDIEGALRGAAQELSGMLLKVRCSLKGVVGACYDNSCRCCCIAHHVQQQQLCHAG